MLTKSITVLGKDQPDRAVPMLVQTANHFESKILFTKDGKTANVKSIMGMLNFGISAGQTIEVQVDGEDETEAMAKMEEFLISR